MVSTIPSPLSAPDGTMASQNNACGSRPRTPTQPSQVAAGSASPRKSPSRSSTSSPSKSTRNPVNTAWVQDQQRRSFLEHLAKWASDHDSSPYFHGKLSLMAQSESAEKIDLGKSVKCILTNTAWTDARKQIVIRLFPPPGRETRYKLVIRCGAGWMSAREYFNKEYFILKHANAGKERFPNCIGRLDVALQWRSELLGPKPAEKDTITIQPLFHPLPRLPLELQQMILGTAAGLTGMYQPCHNYPTTSRAARNNLASVISLSTMFKISKSLNTYLIPWVYHTTNFTFEMTGFTNFLWQSGPEKRPEIRHVTFRFGHQALIHCLRWLAPDPIFNIFHPLVPTNPQALRYLWRCQIQDLTKELHLATLTIDINEIPDVDIPMMVRILRGCFGSIRSVRFKAGTVDVPRDSPRLTGLREGESWREMCREWFARNKKNRRWLPSDVRGKMGLFLEREMDYNTDFFDSAEDA